MDNDSKIEELLSIKRYLEFVNSSFIANHLTGMCEKGWVRNRDPDLDYYLWEYYPIVDIQSLSQYPIPVKDEYLNDFLQSYKERYVKYKDSYRQKYYSSNVPTDDEEWLCQKVSEWQKNVIEDYSKEEHLRRLIWSLGDKYEESSRDTLEGNALLFATPEHYINFNEFHCKGMCFEIIQRLKGYNLVKLKAMDGLWGGYPHYGRKNPILPNVSSLRIPKEIYQSGLGECRITEIGAGVFDFLSKVENLYLPSISKIEWSLWECFSLKNIHIEHSYGGWNSYQTIDGVLFSGDAKILIAYPNQHGEEYEVPMGVEKINNKAFKDCANLKILKLPSTLKSIGLNAFYRCENLRLIIVDNKEGAIEYEGLFGNYGNVCPQWKWNQ